MNIGDRVRLLHSNEEGIVSKLIDAKLVEVEIEDGFGIPVLRNELVIVASEESQNFKSEIQTTSSYQKPKIFADKGVFLAFVPEKNDISALFIVNNTDLEIPFTLFSSGSNHTEGLANGIIQGRTATKTAEFRQSNFEQWPTITFQCLFFKKGMVQAKNPINRMIKIKSFNIF